MKTFLLGLGIFGAIVAAIFVVYTLQQPAEITPTPKPVASPTSSTVVPEINVVNPQADACSLVFTVTASATPSGSPSHQYLRVLLLLAQFHLLRSRLAFSSTTAPKPLYCEAGTCRRIE
jgi:hypothetical protein